MKLLVLFCSLIFILAILILRPQEKAEAGDLAKAKEFGEFLSTHAIVSPTRDTAVLILPEAQTLAPLVVIDQTLTGEQAKIVEEYTQAWTEETFIRDDKFRSQMENLLDLAEKTHSLDLLDKVRGQIIAASFDINTQVSESSQAWIKRYLRLETRENFLEQMQEVHR